MSHSGLEVSNCNELEFDNVCVKKIHWELPYDGMRQYTVEKIQYRLQIHCGILTATTNLSGTDWLNIAVLMATLDV